jgi:hypothetical protein
VKNIIAILLCLFVTTSLLAESKQIEAWGRIVKLDEDASLYGHKIFVFLKVDGKDVAYPLEVNSSNSKTIYSNIEKVAKIKGSAISKEIKYQESKKTVVVFVPKSITALSLSQLQVKKDFKPLQLIPTPIGGKAKVGGGISDTVANTIIIGAGAYLAGSVIKDILENRKKRKK